MKKGKLICCLSAAAVAFESAVLPVQAVEINEDSATGYFYRSVNEPDRDYVELKHHIYKGRPAYCIEPRAFVGRGDAYQEVAVEIWTGASAYTRETIMLASVFGEGYEGREGNLWYAAAQDIIWEETGTKLEWGDKNEEIKKAAAQIRNSITSYRTSPDFHITDTVTDQKAAEPGREVMVDDAVAGRMYKVQDKSGVVHRLHNGQADGLHIFDENKKEINASEITSDTFYVMNSRSDSEGSLIFRGSAGNNRFRGIPIILFGNINAPAAQKHIVTGNVEPLAFAIRIHTSDQPFRIRKTNENGEGQKGAMLSLEKNGEIIDAWTSDGSDHEVYLETGENYQLKETDAPDGYYCRDFEFTVPEQVDGNTITDFTDNEKIRCEILKTDEQGKPVRGARLVLYDVTSGSPVLVKINDNKGNPWVTDGKPRDVSPYLHVSHTYSIVEEDASTEYFLAEDVSFTVPSHAPEKNPVITVKMTDNHIVYRFAKVDENGKPVENAELTVFDLDDNDREVCRFTTESSPKTVGILKRGHRYRLAETKTPDGSYTMTEKEFTVPERHDAEPVMVTCIDHTIVYYADKKDENGQPVPGASMEVHDVTEGADRIVCTFVTTEQPEKLKGLSAGHHYLLHEKAAPAGFYQAEDIPFEVPVTGTDEPVHVQAIDHTIHLPVRKTDTDGHPLTDITLEVFEKDSGESVGVWQTKPDTDIEIGPLVKAGKEYVLRETESVNGYYFHKDISFTVPEHYSEGADITVTMEDEPIHIQVLKEDESGHPLQGAHITLSQKDSADVLHEWDTVSEPHDISAYVCPGKSYVLRETEIVAGHYQAVEQEFTVDRYPPDNNPVITLRMVDETIRYEIAKIDETDHPVKGVHLKVTDRENGKVVDEWDTDDSMHPLDGLLEAGHTYNLEETEWVNGVMKAQDMQFTVPLQGTSVVIRIEMVDETVALSFLKTDEKGKPLSGAELSVTDKNGKEICSFLSTDDPEGVARTKDGVMISTLLKGGESYVLHEKNAPAGYEKAKDIPFTVTGTLAHPQLVSMTDGIQNIWLHLIKMDAGNPDKRLKNAELTVYRKADDSVAADLKGNQVVMKTDQDGNATAVLAWDPEGYYVRETKAPAGYHLSSHIYEVKTSGETGFSADKPVVIKVLDDQEVNTGTGFDWKIPFGISLAFMAVLLAVFKYRTDE